MFFFSILTVIVDFLKSKLLQVYFSFNDHQIKIEKNTLQSILADDSRLIDVFGVYFILKTKNSLYAQEVKLIRVRNTSNHVNLTKGTIIE